MGKPTRWYSWTLVAIATIIPPIIAGLIEYFLTQGVSGWIPLVAGLGGGVFTFLLLSFIGRRSTEMIATPTEEARGPLEQPKVVHPSHPNVPPYKDKIFTPRTIAELLEMVKGQTEIAARHITKPHIGYWLKVDGTILGVSESFKENLLIVHADDSQSQESVFLDFKDSVWGARIRPLAKGDKIVAIGKIESISITGYISLEECELVI